MAHSDSGLMRTMRSAGLVLPEDEDGTLNEKLGAVRRERGGIMSVLTRIDREIRELMLQNASTIGVENKMKVYEQYFRDFQQKHRQYKSLLGDDLMELASAEEYFRQVEQRSEMLSADVNMWMDRDVPPKEYEGIDRDINVKVNDSASQQGTHISNTSSRAKAAAKKAALLVRSEALKKRQELKRKQMELTQLDETLALETEIAAVEAEEQAYIDCTSVAGTKLVKQSKPINIKREPKDSWTLTNIKQEKQIPGPVNKSFSVGATTQVKESYTDPSHQIFSEPKRKSHHFPTHFTTPSSGELRHRDPSSNAPLGMPPDNSDGQMFVMQQLLNVMQLPKTELMKYDGDPLKYWMFVRAFENSLEGTGVRESVKLNRLFQYCTGKALDVIECCSVMDPDEGYSEARRLLQERFGNQFVISKAWIEKVTEGPYLKYGDNDALRKYADSVRSCVVTLTAMDRVNEIDNQVRMGKMVEKLPSFLQGRWRKDAVRHLKIHGCYPDINQLVQFIDTAAEEANDPVFGAGNVQKEFTSKLQRNFPKKRSSGTSFNVQAKKDSSPPSDKPDNFKGGRFPPCQCCSGGHAIYVCDKFKEMNIDKRLEFVKTNKLCFNCFSPHHMSYGCTKTSMCHVNGCNRKHSRLLHLGIGTRDNEETRVKMTDTSRDPNVNPAGQPQTASNSMCGVGGAGTAKIALPIVPVVVKLKDQPNYMTTFALLDSGSTNTFCSKALAEQLGIQGTKTTLSLTTLSRENYKSDTSLISLDIADITGRQLMHLPSVFVIPNLPVLTDSMVTQSDVDKWSHLHGITLPTADQEQVNLLIGQDVPMALAPLEVRCGRGNEPYATRTPFGWTLNGPLDNGISRKAISNFVHAEQGLQTQIEKFWRLEVSESVTEDIPQMSINDKRVINTWNDSIHMKDGHYELPIPFKNQPPDIPSNYCVAESRLENLGRKLSKNQALYEKYKSGIQELLDKGYAEKVSDDCVTASENPIWYLPHHGVTNENKPGKLRIVFDCAAKYAGISLNDVVHQGPDLTNKLIGVLLRFRQDTVAFMGDIEGMFHQVKVDPSDRDALRFLWWRNGDINGQPEVYRMTVHLFGGVWSPSCASFAVRRTAEDNEEDFDPITIQTVLENFYVDDCLRSVPSVCEAIKLVKELSALLQRGGFKLTKWISNDRQVLESVPEDERAKCVKDIDLNSSALPSERALGVQWNTETDEFGFKIQLKEKPSTRRGLISLISSVYDPFGFVCPVILKAKMIFQSECRLKKGWDEPLEDVNETKWDAWKQRLPDIQQFKVDRCVKPEDFGEVTDCQIHHFSDASADGYGSVAYLRLVNSDSKIHVSFLMGKARLAPIKQLSIPRLELSAAVVAVRVDQMLRRELKFDINQSVFWTDSTVVLQYIKNESKRFQTFVANRVTTIHAGSSPDSWRHVESKLNPADDASRGLGADEIVASSRWKHGPDFLWQDPSQWPTTPEILELSVTDTEIKKEAKVCLICEKPVECAVSKLIARFSSWTKLKKSVAWILRLKKYLLEKVRSRTSAKMSSKSLTVTEIKDAELQIVKFVQQNHFPDEIRTLSKNKDKSVSKSSSIYRLDPTMNADGILCVRGRLQAAAIPNESKHQIILPKDHHVVTLVVRHYHELLGHSGREHVLSHLRQMFWIVKARVVINKVLRSCVHCKRRQGPRGAQRMADLPEDRVIPGKPPFAITGIDCFGPFVVKRGRIHVKRYGCLFTCLTTRAIHIEKIDSMDTDSFINALRRFECRRGKPEKIRSDNGSNFKGGERELNEAIGAWNQKKIEGYMIQKEIIWEFNPPTASHMGGIWERQIRTVRKILNALLANETLDDEGLATLFCEIEAIVNSRPITVISDNPLDAEALTPNHLLLLRSGPDFPPGKFCKEDTYLKRWKQVQFLADRFWKRWVHEYLPTLQLRQKWLKPRRNFCEGDVVLMIDENTHRNMWPLGRITKTFPGRDGLVRSVELKSKGTLLKRPVHKLCLLESVTN